MDQPLPRLTLQRVKIATNTADEAGVLVLADGRIAAVLARLDDPCHGPEQGCWFLEAGFGHCDCASSPEPFLHLADALRWVAARLGIEADAPAIQIEPGFPVTATDHSAAASLR